eukprot:g15690.t1
MASADLDALKTLFHSTGGDGWAKKNNWATDAELSTWHGVRKVDEAGRVVELDLFANKLQGPIPEALGTLSNLTELKLFGNKLSGPIPDVLGALTNLTRLTLSNNHQLVGPFPDALGALTNLRHLGLCKNKLKGPVPEVLAALINLVDLDLGNNQLTGPIPEALGALTNLSWLSLGNNQLTGPIPGSIGALTSLARLTLGNNRLSGPIPEALGDLSNLTELGLGSNFLKGPIPEALGALTNLRQLGIGSNELTGPIPETLGALTNLTHLGVGRNQLTGHIPEVLGDLTNLTRLTLGNNRLTGPIPETLGALTNLVELYLGRNHLTGTVPLSIWKLPCTKSLDLTGNLLTRFTEPEEKSASTKVVLACMKRLERRTFDCSERRRGDNNQSRGKGLLSADNPWEFPPAAVVVNGRKSIRKYYDTWKQCDFSLVEIHSLKVVFVGAHGAGKTSLARSIRMGRGDRTPEVDENSRTTVGVDLHSHILRNGTECKIYDVAGQVTYYGLHQFFLTERAVYVIVSDATKFEGLSGKELDEAIERNILEWVSLLHMRTPLCTVMLVASHYDVLHGTTEENEQLLVTVEQRFSELHKKWKALRHRQNSSIDKRMSILPGVFPVGCKLASESSSHTAGDGLGAVDEALSKQTVVISSVPPSWVAARHVLEQVGSAHDGGSGDTSVSGCRQPWALRSLVHAKFKSFVEEGRRNASQGVVQHFSASSLSRLHEDGIRHSMDGAIELRAFSGTVISHDVFVVLDVMWLAGVLKPILDHRGVTRNEMGDKVFAGRALDTSQLIRWASELVGRGVLRKGFARLLWGLHEQAMGDGDEPVGMEPAIFEDILERTGVAIPLPVDDNADSNAPPREGAKSPQDGVHDGVRCDSTDLLVIMRLPLEADANTQRNLMLSRQTAFPNGGDRNNCLKAVFEFDHAGAPHGLPERVMALSHKIGAFSSRARWRLGGLLLLDNPGVGGASSIILEYDNKSKTFCIEALGQSAVHIQAVQFVISALYHVARDFPGASWTGWMGCGMSHEGERMYLLATSNEKQNLNPGADILPLTRDSPRDEWRKQQNMCGMQGFDARGSCTLDPDIFGRVLDVTQSFNVSDEGEARSGVSEDRNTNPNPMTTSQRLIQIAGDVSTLTKTVGRVQGGIHRVEGGMDQVKGGMDRVEARIERVEEGIDRVDGRVGQVEERMQKMDEDLQRIARGTQETLTRLKNLQAPNFPYPHLVHAEEVQADGKRNAWSRLRSVVELDMALHFVCPYDMSKVPCGDGGNGYRLRKTRAWVKKVSPALQVTLVTAKVALKAVAGVDFPGLSDFLQDVKDGLVEELGDRTLDDDALLRVASGDESARPDVQRVTRASYEAIKVFMEKEERKRRRNPSGYVDFRSSMERVPDGDGDLVWVRTENVQKWKDMLLMAASSK